MCIGFSMPNSHALTTVSSAAVLDLLSICRDRNLLSNKQLLALGLEHLDFCESRTDSVDPLQRIPEQSLVQLWRQLSDLQPFKEQGLSLLIGQHINPKAKGLLASWVSQTATLSEALDVFCHNISLMNPSEHWEIRKSQRVTTLVFSFGVGHRYPSVAIERSMSALLAWGRALSGQKLPVLEACFSFSEPLYVEKFEALFGASLKFLAKENSISIDSKHLLLPVLSSNHLLKSMLEQQAKLLLSNLDQNASVTDKVRALIKDAFASNHALTIEQACHALSLSRQTLYRHLKQENHTFKSLLENERKAHSLFLLEQKKLSINAVALQLGYVDTSSFNKAFKRWFGLPPKAYLMRKPSSC